MEFSICPSCGATNFFSALNGDKFVFRVSDCINVPLKDGKITDENRLIGAMPTIKYLIKKGAKVILCSHLGKPKGEPRADLSLAPVARRLGKLLDKEIIFAADDIVVGENARKVVAGMTEGDVVLLQNVRYRPEETKNEEPFSQELASLAEIFVNDAFGTAHRAHCSTVGVTSFLDTKVCDYISFKKSLNILVKPLQNRKDPS